MAPVLEIEAEVAPATVLMAAPNQLTLNLPGTERHNAAAALDARAARVKAARKACATARKATEAAYPLILTCSVCQALVARQTRREVNEAGEVQYSAVVARHKAQRDSFNDGDSAECFGSGYPGLEYSVQGLVDFYTKKAARAKSLAARHERVLDPEVEGVWDGVGRFGPIPMVILRNSPHFAAARRAELADMEIMYRQITHDLEALAAGLLAWTLAHPDADLPKATVRTGYTRAHFDPVRELARRGFDTRATLTSSLVR